MDTFYKRFISLCTKADKTPTGVAEEIGISRAAVTKWKKGSGANDATIAKIADYFGVSFDWLKYGEKSDQEGGKNCENQNSELDLYLEDLKNRKELRMLFSLARGASKEDVERAVKIIEALFGK